MRTADFGGRESIHLRRVHQRFDGDFFAFGIARAARGSVIQRFDSKTSHHGSVRIPENRCMFGWSTEHALMAGLDGLDELVVLGNFCAGDRDENLGLDTVVWMFLPQVENELFDGGADFFERHCGRDSHIEKSVRAIRRAADAPREAAANAADVYDAGLAVVSGFALPRGNPIVNWVENLFHAE